MIQAEQCIAFCSLFLLFNAAMSIDLLSYAHLKYRVLDDFSLSDIFLLPFGQRECHVFLCSTGETMAPCVLFTGDGEHLGLFTENPDGLHHCLKLY